MGAAGRVDERYVFAVPEKEWKKARGKLEWPEAGNIEWFPLPDSDIEDIYKLSKIRRLNRLSRLIKDTARRTESDNIFLIWLAEALPLLPLILPRKTRVSGIVYKIFLRSQKQSCKTLYDRFSMWVAAKSRNVGNVFILNDFKSTEELNELYHTRKFRMLPDPVPDIDMTGLRNLRESFEIPEDDIVFLHFGSMERRKGTLEILKAIDMMAPGELSGRTFVFAGKVTDEIAGEFEALVSKVKNQGARVVVINEFVPFGELHSLCHTSDCILIPYLMTDLSSGAIGYAAVLDKPVIGPGDGLIGELIRANSLGETLPVINPGSLKESILKFTPHGIRSDYRQSNTVEAFTSTVFS